MQKSEMGVILSEVYANYRSQIKSPEALLQLWFSAFGDLDAPLLRAAVQKHMACSAFAPKISEIASLLEQDGRGLRSALRKREGVRRNARTFAEIRAGRYERTAEAEGGRSPCRC